ncbi:phytanoyl-CoA dioxygenase family protein [Rhodobacteraceae bacterium]|nr:phytanoyl-CoA dioxygenase family protein [Paracoccaceae bacterium]
MQKRQPVWLSDQGFDLAAFRQLVEQTTNPADYPLAAEVSKNIPIYDGDRLRNEIATEAGAAKLMEEFNHVFTSGPGIIAIKKGYDDIGVVDDVTDVLFGLIEEEEAQEGTSGDHFATAGSNSRLWNAHQKLAARNPALFIRYNANDLLRFIYQSWLGTGYQITAQVNVVRPGGGAQQAHRDYHMGIQTPAAMAATPAGQHATVPLLTLQGAIAHVDVPIEAGPTRLLPFSQTYLSGYLAILRDDFRSYFEENFVQLELEKGDLLFFNPAVFHAAGDNRTEDVQRIVNLLQVGSIYGRTMEYVDRTTLTKQIYPELLNQIKEASLSATEIESVIAAASEAYPFPANLDNDAPIGPSGLTPASQQEILRQALNEGWEPDRLNSELDDLDARRFG